MHSASKQGRVRTARFPDDVGTMCGGGGWDPEVPAAATLITATAGRLDHRWTDADPADIHLP